MLFVVVEGHECGCYSEFFVMAVVAFVPPVSSGSPTTRSREEERTTASSLSHQKDYGWLTFLLAAAVVCVFLYFSISIFALILLKVVCCVRWSHF